MRESKEVLRIEREEFSFKPE